MAKIGLLILCIFAVILVLFTSGCIWDSDIKITGEMYSDLDEFTSDIQNLFKEFEADLLVTADKISESDSEDIEDELDGILIKYPWIRNILYSDVNGEIFIGNPAPDAIFNKIFVTERTFDGKTVVSLPPITSESSGTISGIAVPVYSDDGKYAGYITVWWVNSYLFMYNYEKFKEVSGYHISVQEGSKIIYDSVVQIIGRDLSSLKRTIEYESLADGTYTQETLNPITLEEVTINGIWKECPLTDTTLIVYLGKSDMKKLTELPEKYSDVSADDAVNAVMAAYSYDRTHTKEETLEFINTRGNLAGGTFNLYAFDKAGNVIAASGDANKLVGVNEIDVIGAYGTKAIREIMIRASQGYGYVCYYQQTTHEMYPEKSIPVIVFIAESDFGDYLTCSILPMRTVIEENDHSRFVTLTNTMNSVHEYYLKYGSDALNDAVRNGYFKDEHVVVLNYKGRIVSDSDNPEYTGYNTFEYVDDYGNSITRQAISRAKLGGGYGVYAKTEDGNKKILLYENFPLNNELMVISEIELNSI